MGIFDNLNNVMQSSLRMADTARVFTKHGFDLIASKEKINHKKAALALRKSFSELGATYIKLGQLIASAPGLFPREYVEEMQLCLDNVNPLPYNVIEKVLQDEFKGKHHEIFSEIDKKPIASASIAQVHGARLVTGQDVVIKVQRPGIDNKLNADLNLLFISAYLFEKLAPGASKASLTGIVEDFHNTIMEEVDFFKEASNIEEFDSFLETIQQDRVVVPKVYHQATTLRVLTMERFYGVPLTDLESIRKLVKKPEDTLVLALNTWFQSLMVCGFFHADVHAGNLMVLNDGRIGFIDFGIVGRMDKLIWNALLDLVTSLGTQDYRLMAKALIGMNATDARVDVDKFSAELELIFADFNALGDKMQSTGDIDEAKINEMLMNLVEVAEKNGLRIPREFALLFKQLLYFDRYTTLLAPDLNIADSKKIQMRALPSKKSKKQKKLEKDLLD